MYLTAGALSTPELASGKYPLGAPYQPLQVHFNAAIKSHHSSC
jgi:hypothetical protein